MKVLVIGATGRTGKDVVRLSASEREVRATVRKREDAPALEALGAETVLADLTKKDTLLPALRGCDAVVCAAGAGVGGDPEEVDHQGTVDLVRAAEAAGVARFILISSVGTTYPEKMPPMLGPYLRAKRKAEEVLEESSLEYTIVRPGGLTDDAGTGKVRAGTLGESGRVSREDVARVTVAALDLPNTHGKAFDLLSGDADVEKALQNL